MIWKVLYNFVGNGEGWTEGHYINRDETNPRAFLATCKGVAIARAQFLGTPFIINAIRISAYANPDGTKARRSSFLLKEEFRQNGAAAQWFAEPSVVALQATGYPDIAVAPQKFWGNKANTLCGGPQDDAVDQAGNVFPARTNLGAAFVTWKQALIAGRFGWVAQDQLADAKIVNITQNTNGTVTFAVDPATTAALTLGVTYPCRVRQINQGRSPLNGQLNLYLSTFTTFISKEVVAFALAQEQGMIKVYKPVSSFVQYGDIVLEGLSAKHKRYQGFLRRPGRAKARVRG